MIPNLTSQASNTRSLSASNISSTSNNAIPEIDDTQDFMCPITQDIMEYPVLAADGRNYERTAIIEWLKKSGEYEYRFKLKYNTTANVNTNYGATLNLTNSF
ncbi:MAG: hypothetical protein HC930_06330 [Hydrococcus sp. SU_1_0]|nr:hypothetical protein [Hydrococcus sp. SU_1_0]